MHLSVVPYPPAPPDSFTKTTPQRNKNKNSALDTQREREVQEALLALHKARGMTMLIIAHRLRWVGHDWQIFIRPSFTTPIYMINQP